MSPVLRMIACLGALAIAIPTVVTSASGAEPPGANSHVSFQSGLLRRPPKLAAPSVQAQPLAWPRLDSGAVICRTQADLARLARRRAGEAVNGPVDCRIIQQPVGITIVQREGPGRTEISGTSALGYPTAWTDAWLPDKAPGTANR